MKENKNLNIITSLFGLVLVLVIYVGFKMIATSIDNKAFGRDFNVPDATVTIDINNKDFLTDYEAVKYLGISYEILITQIGNGSYTGRYVKDHNGQYVFPKEDLKNWFNEYMKNNKTIDYDSSKLPSKNQ